MDRRLGDMSSEVVVSFLSSARRVEKKGRKSGAVQDANWEEVLRENLEKTGVKAPDTVKMSEESWPDAVPEETESSPRSADAGLIIETEEEFARVINDIKKMADNPEKLVESHLGVFIDPIPPGKLLNSRA